MCCDGQCRPTNKGGRGHLYLKKAHRQPKDSCDASKPPVEADEPLYIGRCVGQRSHFLLDVLAIYLYLYVHTYCIQPPFLLQNTCIYMYCATHVHWTMYILNALPVHADILFSPNQALRTAHRIRDARDSYDCEIGTGQRTVR